MGDKAKLLAKIPGIIAVVAGVIMLAFFVIKFLWAWIIPDIFPGAVKEGLIAGDISWFTSFKLALIIGMITGSIKGKMNIKSD